MGNAGFHLTAYDLLGGLVFLSEKLEKLFYKKVKIFKKMRNLLHYITVIKRLNHTLESCFILV